MISQAERRIYFAVSDSNDLGKIDKQSNFAAHKLKGLPSRTCIVENKDSGEWVKEDGDGDRVGELHNGTCPAPEGVSIVHFDPWLNQSVTNASVDGAS